MAAFVLRRSIGAALTFVAATFTVFVVALALPGDPARVLAGRRQVPEATLEAIRARYHLHDPLPLRYVRWLGQLVRGDLGESYASRRAVRDMLVQALPVTLTLVALTIAIEVVLGLLVGTTVGRRRGTGLDRAVVVFCTVGIAAPLFVVASTAQLLVGVKWGLLPVAGTGEGLRSFVLPATVLALAGLAFAIRLVRADVLEGANALHVVVAESKGIRAGRVTRRHILRNHLGSFVTFVGLELGALVGGSVVVERVFNLPGVGGQMARAISQRDTALIVGFTVAVIAVYLVVDVVVDVAMMLLDPRLRAAAR